MSEFRGRVGKRKGGNEVLEIGGKERGTLICRLYLYRASK